MTQLESDLLREIRRIKPLSTSARLRPESREIIESDIVRATSLLIDGTDLRGMQRVLESLQSHKILKVSKVGPPVVVDHSEMQGF